MKVSIAELETLRKKTLYIYLFGIIITIIITLLIAVYIKELQYSMIFIILGSVITILIGSNMKGKFEKAFKSSFVFDALNKIFNDLVYEPNYGIAEETIYATKMMDMGDEYSANDYISGKYKNVRFEQSDVGIKEQYKDNEGHTHYRTIFLGRWMIFEFNKSFKTDIQVCDRGFTNATRNNLFSKQKLSKIELEDIDFNDQFKTYAQDDHDAFYILTPNMMEKIKKIKKETDGYLLFCFVDNKLHIGVQNNIDSFEHSILYKIDKEKIEKALTKQIKLITQFIDELNLDNDLFKEEK